MSARIFYYCYSHSKPTGGQKHTYQHVDILNAAGIEAYAFHEESNFRLKWFENDTRVVDRPTVERLWREGDWFVLPEDLGVRALEYPGPRIIFNKGLFNGFYAFGLQTPQRYPYLDEETRGAFVVSEHNGQHLRFAYPDLAIFRVFPSIDPLIFRPRTLKEKKPRIVYLRKSFRSTSVIHHTIVSRAHTNRNNLRNFEWQLLTDLSEREIAAALRDSLLALFFNLEEGLPRFPLEAMACGCLVLTTVQISCIQRVFHSLTY
ncbi:MAG: hypothetical protein ACK5AZ_21935 [Bryobacteraceae bacterium]